MAKQDILKKIVVTEKASRLNRMGQYVFMVERHATKNEVKKAVKFSYNVDPVSVNIVVKPPKRKKLRGLKGTQRGYKKAIVTLKKGHTIDVA
ncbi:MAG: 50S ribosomal protein L23 [Candidatus Liptonbacteria bacterium]|nr:50S ribosomal protein L23 [Candidatus Liptonbacteria bacterium]